MSLSRIFTVGLATLRTIETFKEALPVTPAPQLKSTAAGIIAAGLTVLDGERDIAKVILTGAAAAGAASLLHDGQESLRRYTDNQIVSVLTAASKRRSE